MTASLARAVCLWAQPVAKSGQSQASTVPQSMCRFTESRPCQGVPGPASMARPAWKVSRGARCAQLRLALRLAEPRLSRRFIAVHSALCRRFLGLLVRRCSPCRGGAACGGSCGLFACFGFRRLIGRVGDRHLPPGFSSGAGSCSVRPVTDVVPMAVWKQRFGRSWRRQAALDSNILSRRAPSVPTLPVLWRADGHMLIAGVSPGADCWSHALWQRCQV